MKVSFYTGQKQYGTNVKFEGYKPLADNKGETVYEFNFPFDQNKYDCYVEFYDVKQDKKSKYLDINDILTSREYERKLFRDETYNGEKGFKLTSGKNYINLSDYGLNGDKPFAYHYKIVEKNNPGNTFFRTDAGNIIDKRTKTGMGYEIYNVVYPGMSKVNRGGAMMLVIPDNYNVNWVYDDKEPTKITANKNLPEAKKSVKNLVNKLGGSLAGLEKDVENGKFDNFTRIISTPIFTDDSLTSHSYWNKNCFQTALSLGNINNYASLQRKMFAKGINFVSDGAFVNEGLEGIHFKHILKWGEKSPYFYWFRIYALQNDPFTLGIFGKNMTDDKGNSNVAHRVVNSEYIYSYENGKITYKKNKAYDCKKPTYIQVYDKRLIKDVSKLDPQKLIKSYDKLSPDNIFEINNHNDTIVPYSFPINPKTYHKNVLNLIEHNKKAKKPVKLDSFEATRMLTKFENFEFEEKFESGIETWDSNSDIIKLNYGFSHTDTKHLKQTLSTEERNEMIKLLKKKNIEVQDYAITSGQYWTRKTRQILLLNAAQNIKKSEVKTRKSSDNSESEAYLNMITDKCDNKIFPTQLKTLINKDIIKNVLNGDYNLKSLSENDIKYKDAVISGLMDMPLDSVEFGDDIAAVFSSPYLTKRAQDEKDIGISRYDFIKNKSAVDKEYKKTFEEMNNIYTNQMYNFANEILDKINKKHTSENPSSGLKDESGNLTDFGKYVIPLLTQEIAKFAVIKSLSPDAKFKTNDKGEIIYDYKKLKQLSLPEIGINADCPENEAEEIISKIRRHIEKISPKDKEELVDALAKSIKGTNAESFKFADMIIDRTQAGLDWRIDAAKDIVDLNSLRNRNNNFRQSWTSAINFWKKFNKTVLNENPNSYLTAEITAIYELVHKTNSPYTEEFPDFSEAERQFLNKTGITTKANYSNFYQDLANIFTKSSEDGSDYTIGDTKRMFNTLIGSLNGERKEFLYSASLPSVIYSYTMAGNHDLPRILHVLSTDMGLFYSDLTDKNNGEYRELAYRILNDRFDGKEIPDNEISKFNWSDVSSKAVAMGDALNRAFGDTLRKRYGENTPRQKELWEKISPSIADLSNGFYKGKHIEADSFGVNTFDKTIEAVIEQAEFAHGLKLNDDERRDLINDTFETIIEPSYRKFLAIMKYLVALPGNPTLFSGDEAGTTGYETKTKNIYLKNRSYIHNEWLDKNDKDFKGFLDEKKKALDMLLGFRKRPEMHALNDGAPFTLNLMHAHAYDKKTGQRSNTEITGILRQSSDGAMAISLLNPSGVHKDFSDEYEPSHIKLDSIDLSSGSRSNIRLGAAAGLTPGTIFANGYNKDEKYVVREFDGKYFIKRYYGQNRADGPIEFDDTVLVLYHMPGMIAGKCEEYKPNFKGRRILYNPQYHFVSKPYTTSKAVSLGERLSLKNV